MSAFTDAVKHVLELEGVFSNDAHDSGGKTKYGVTEAEWRDFCTKHDMTMTPIERFTVEQATTFYRARFWDANHLDELVDPLIAAEVFEAGINCGLKNGALFLQRALNVLRYPQWTALVEDGVLGGKTQDRLAMLLAAGYRDAILVAQNGEQYAYYKTLSIANPEKFNNFTRGWMKRVMLAKGGV